MARSCWLEPMKIITLNLNGIRSAARKGFFKWLARTAGRRGVRAGAEGAGRRPRRAEMRAPGGFRGYFHHAEKKGYSGVGLYCRREPDRVVEGIGNREVDAEGRYLRADFGPLSVISVYLPSGSAGAHRQAGQVPVHGPFLPASEEARGGGPRNPAVRRLEHRAQGDRSQELARQPEELGLPAGGARSG